MLDGLSALIYLAIAGWLVYAVAKPGPALTALLAIGPWKQRWLFLVVIIACLSMVMSLVIGSFAGLTATYVRYMLTHR